MNVTSAALMDGSERGRCDDSGFHNQRISRRAARLARNPPPVKHYLLLLEFSDSYEARRPAFRDEHLEKAWAAVARGELVLAGALTDPLDTGVILFKGDSPDVVEKFVREDPYVNNGLVRNWRVREWATVVGEDAISRMYPA